MSIKGLAFSQNSNKWNFGIVTDVPAFMDLSFWWRIGILLREDRVKNVVISTGRVNVTDCSNVRFDD